MTHRRRGWSVLLVLAALGCAHRPGGAGGGEPSPPASRFYPLSIGREWTYDVELLGEHRTVVVQIVRQEGGFFVDSQGGQIRADAGGVRDRQRYLIQNPVREGHTWNNILSPGNEEQYRIESAGAPCSAPAGRFERCVVVAGRTLAGVSNATLLNLLTFAEGVGLVRSEVFLEQRGRQVLQSRLQLKSYLSAPPPGAP